MNNLLIKEGPYCESLHKRLNLPILAPMERFYPNYSEIFQTILRSLQEQRVAVLGHLRPDGDCIGSQIALTRALRGQGIAAICVHEDPIPRVLQSFVADTPIVQSQELTDPSYAAFYVDCADPGRVGAHLSERFAHIIACVDHHISNPGYAYHNIIDAGSAATAQILAGLFLDAGIPIDAVMAQALYLGILTDTGQFRHGTTSAQVFEIAAKLVQQGAQPDYVATELYERETMERIQLRRCFMESLRLELGGRLCTGCLTPEIFKRTQTTAEDAEGLVDITRSIEGVRIGISLEQQDDGMIKGSLRCKDPHYRVDHIARLLGGGGHVCAAGFKIEGDLAEFYPRLIGLVKKHLDAI